MSTLPRTAAARPARSILRGWNAGSPSLATLRGAGRTPRPATLDDVRWTARFRTAREPSEPANEESIRHWWRSTDPERIEDRWIVLEDAEAIGFASYGHPIWAKAPMRAARLLAEFASDARRSSRLRSALELLEPYAREDR